MLAFDEYATRFSTIAMTRDEEGILEVRLHTDDGPLRWSARTHQELQHALGCIADDLENEVVILTGTGDEFSGPAAPTNAPIDFSAEDTFAVFQRILRIVNNLLRIEVPMISCINGPALRHAELPLLCDIVLAADTTVIQDTGHFEIGIAPGDVQSVIMPGLLGWNRGRYFLLTGERIDAQQALTLGLVNEVMSNDQLADRARELALRIRARTSVVRRATRLMLTERIRRDFADMLGYGVALQCLGMVDKSEQLRSGSTS
jgi:enoyl-CoA hydratase/carnithine racemase